MAARRIGLSETRFREVVEDLRDNGFPLPDAVTGNYDLEAIDKYVARRNPAYYPDLSVGENLETPQVDEDAIMRRIRSIRKS